MTNERETAMQEAFRSLRASVKYASGDRPMRTILVVDVDRESPSGVAAGLAESLAHADDCSLLIDANVRGNPSEGPGFTDLLAGDVGTDVIEREADGKLGRLSVGKVLNPDLLVGDRFDEVTRELSSNAEFVIFSCAPLPNYGDAISLAPRVDGVILVITGGKTRRAKAIEARDALDRVGAHTLGLVMVERGRRWF